MKTAISLLLTLIMTISSFVGCDSNSQKDVWDNTISTDFEQGDGTEADPYRIATCAQLAYLAKKVNSGETYSGQHFSIVCDLDLNNIEWTPIGNGVYSFEGFIDGNEHTITNIKITELNGYTSDHPAGANLQSAAGLFGTCLNATIKNLNISNVNILLNNINEFDQVFAGVLTGHFNSTSDCAINNIKISDAVITTLEADSSVQNISLSSMHLGGVAGYIRVSQSAECKINALQADVNISCNDSFASVNYIGGVAGYVTNACSFECSDFASYLTAEWPFEVGENYAGAFGGVLYYNSDKKMSISNAFAETKINRELANIPGYYICEGNAIIGTASHGKNLDGKVSGKFEFENLFGYVKYTNKNKGTTPVFELYSMPKHAAFTEKNCLGCEFLPENHCLNSELWDLNDTNFPILK